MWTSRISQRKVHNWTSVGKLFIVGSSTEKTIPKVPNVSLSKFLRNRNQTNFIIAHISNEEILDIVNSLEDKSTGPFSIPLKLLAVILDLIIIPLAYIINFSLSMGEFPDLLKLVKVIPIHKGGSTQDVNNFQPISLLLTKWSKKSCINNFMLFSRNTIYYFKTNLALEKIILPSMLWLKLQRWLRYLLIVANLDDGIFINLRKAFNTVNHEILWNKLEHYGIRGNMLKWFQSYLSYHKQYVSVNGQSSELLAITCGVPQGFVLL